MKNVIENQIRRETLEHILKRTNICDLIVKGDCVFFSSDQGNSFFKISEIKEDISTLLETKNLFTLTRHKWGKKYKVIVSLLTDEVYQSHYYENDLMAYFDVYEWAVDI